ncbi:MAG: cupin domain-containing protein [Planctomycetota bacterium]
MSTFPDRVRRLPAFGGHFDAFQLTAQGCDVLFASYPAGTQIDPHTHPTENYGIVTKGELILELEGSERRYGLGEWYHIPVEAEHGARFEVETGTIELWFEPETS